MRIGVPATQLSSLGVDDVDVGIGEAGTVLDAVFLEGEGASVGREAEDRAVGVVAGHGHAAGKHGCDEGTGDAARRPHGYTAMLSAARRSPAMLSL